MTNWWNNFPSEQESVLEELSEMYVSSLKRVRERAQLFLHEGR